MFHRATEHDMSRNVPSEVRRFEEPRRRVHLHAYNQDEERTLRTGSDQYDLPRGNYRRHQPRLRECRPHRFRLVQTICLSLNVLTLTLANDTTHYWHEVRNKNVLTNFKRVSVRETCRRERMLETHFNNSPMNVAG